MKRHKILVWFSIASVILSCQFLCSQSARRQIPSFRADVVSVFVRVAVTDSLNRYVTGLESGNFKIYEDRVEQAITHFSKQSAAISAGFIFDVSRSMGYQKNIRIAKKDFLPFLESRNKEDEYFLVTFNNTVRLVEAFTENEADVQNEIAAQKSGGFTALYDAVYMGLDQVRRGKNEKKALILVTDGEDNSSRYRTSEVHEFCKEAGVPIYAIGLPGPEGYGSGLLKQLVGVTGGRVFFSSSYGDLEYYIDLIHSELRSQYLLGYTPTNTNRDGKWRKITVKLDAPRGFPKLAVHARQGYYAPPN